jgi:hypothetical protein
MRVRIELVRGAAGLGELLRADGWRLEGAVAGPIYASHPEADDEPSARHRLHGLGLLISGRLRIEFEPFRRAGSG